MEASKKPKEMLEISPWVVPLGKGEQCPFCGGDNRCRVAKGTLYKGACWCQEIIVPDPVLKRLSEEHLEPACLCRACLDTVARLSSEGLDMASILAEMQGRTESPSRCCDDKDFYLDDHGNTVFTAAYHRKRGSCCANGCRHCPY